MEIKVNNNNAVIYARYSSDAQTEQSIEGQIRTITEYAKSNNIPIIDSYIDRAISGKREDRPEFQRMIYESKKKNFGYVLVYRFDRFSRDRLNSLVYKRELKKNGVKVISVTEYISDDPQGILFESIIDGYSEFYSAELAQKVRRGNRESRIKGLFTGGKVLYGYEVVDKRYKISLEESIVVKKIFDLVIRKETFKNICEYFNSRGITHRGKKFIPSFIGEVISNEKYIGKVTVNGETFTNIVPPMIEEDIFIMASKNTMENKNRAAHYKEVADYLLGGKAYCGYCGEKLVGESGYSKTKVPHYYYKCRGRKKRINDCKLRSFQKDFLEKLVVDNIKEVLLQSEVLEDIAIKIVEAYNSITQKDDALTINEKELSKNKKEIENVINAIKSGIVSNTLKETLAELESQKQKLEDEHIKLKTRSHYKLQCKDAMNFLMSLLSIDNESEKYRKILIDRFVRKVIVYDDKVDILLYPIDDHNIFDLNNDNKNSVNGHGESGRIQNPTAHHYRKMSKNLISLKKALQFAEFFYGALLNCYSVLVINLINVIILQDDKILNISI